MKNILTVNTLKQIGEDRNWKDLSQRHSAKTILRLWTNCVQNLKRWIYFRQIIKKCNEKFYVAFFIVDFIFFVYIMNIR